MTAKRVILLTNEIRDGHGLPRLKSSPLARRSAQSKARYVARTGRLEHGTWWTRFARRLRKPWGENLASDYPSASGVVDAWWASPTHRANILNPEFRVIGVGRKVDASGDVWWVQHFAGPVRRPRRRRRARR